MGSRLFITVTQKTADSLEKRLTGGLLWQLKVKRCWAYVLYVHFVKPGLIFLAEFTAQPTSAENSKVQKKKNWAWIITNYTWTIPYAHPGLKPHRCKATPTSWDQTQMERKTGRLSEGWGMGWKITGMLLIAGPRHTAHTVGRGAVNRFL